jgi:hypothetical protein
MEVSGSYGKAMEALLPDRGSPPFHQLLIWHLDNGTRPRGSLGDVGMRWTNAEFAAAVGVSEHTVRDWRNAMYPPSENNLRGIEKALFGENREYGPWRLKLRQALSAARQAGNARSAPNMSAAMAISAKSRGDSSNGSDPPKGSQEILSFVEEAGWGRRRRQRRLDHQARPPYPEFDEPTPSASDWEPYGTKTLWPGLAELIVHKPPLSNAPDTFQLRVSLSLAQYPDEIRLDESQDLSVRIGLKEATLIPHYENCQPIEGTRLGEEAMPRTNVIFKAGVWNISGPRPRDDHLDGWPLGQEPLCAIQCGGSGSAELTVTLRSRKKALDVVPDDPETDLSPLKQKILQLFLQKCQPSDTDGFVTWGRGSLRRKRE